MRWKRKVTKQKVTEPTEWVKLDGDGVRWNRTAQVAKLVDGLSSALTWASGLCWGDWHYRSNININITTILLLLLLLLLLLNCSPVYRWQQKYVFLMAVMDISWTSYGRPHDPCNFAIDAEICCTLIQGGWYSILEILYSGPTRFEPLLRLS